MQRSHLKWVLAPVILLAGSQLARAEVIINIDQVGSNVVATASGSIDLTDLTYAMQGDNRLQLNPSQDILGVGPTGFYFYQDYEGLTGPASLGPGISTKAETSGSGNAIQLFGQTGDLDVPSGYVSGASLSATGTYAGQTFSSLGLTPGTYTYTWGTGADADSLTVNIGVPLPSAFAGGSVGLLLLAGWAWRQRRSAASIG